MTKLSVKKDDKVLVITGKDKGKQGKVLEVLPKDNKVLVEDVNVVTKHQKPRSQQDKGGLIKKSAPIEISNVMVVCPECGKATRVARKNVEGKNTRVCKKCGAGLDKAMSKTVKNAQKKENKEVAKAEKKATKSEK